MGKGTTLTMEEVERLEVAKEASGSEYFLLDDGSVLEKLLIQGILSKYRKATELCKRNL